MRDNLLFVGPARDAGEEAGGTRFGEVTSVDDSSGETSGGSFAEEAEALARGSERNLIGIHAEGGLVYFYAVGMNGAAGVGAGPEGIAQVSAIECDGRKTIPSELAIGPRPANSSCTPVNQASAIWMKKNYTSRPWDCLRGAGKKKKCTRRE